MGSFAHRMKYPLPKEVKKNRPSCRPSLRDLGGKCHLGRDLTLIEGVISPIFSPGNRVSESDVADGKSPNENSPDRRSSLSQRVVPLAR
jgi:hypothetical protein